MLTNARRTLCTPPLVQHQHALYIKLLCLAIHVSFLTCYETINQSYSPSPAQLSANQPTAAGLTILLGLLKIASAIPDIDGPQGVFAAVGIMGHHDNGLPLPI